MSNSSHRSIARIPLHVFTDLVVHRDDNPHSPSDLRDDICKKLLGVSRGIASNNNNYNSSGGAPSYWTTEHGITTVGQLMRLAPTALLRALDPLLTNGKKKEGHFLLNRINQFIKHHYLTDTRLE